MITIKCGEELIYHPRHKDLRLIAPRLVLEDNAAGSLDFTIFNDNLNYDCVKKLYPVISVIRDGKVIFKGRAIADRHDFYNGRTVEVEGKLAFFNDSYVEPFSFQGSPADFFAMLIENHNAMVMPWQRFKVGRVTVQDKNDYIVRSSERMINTWTALKEKCFASGLGGHICVRYETDGDYVDWLEDYTKLSSQSIRFAENIISLSLEVDATETYTAIRPVGAEVDGQKLDISSVNGGKTYLVNEEKAREFGIIFAPEEKSVWEDVTLPENLLKKARIRLENTMVAINETYEIKAVDLHLTDDRIEALNICEYVPIKSKPHGIDGSFLLSKAEVYIDAPQESVYYLGVSRRVFSDMKPVGTSVRDPIPKKVSKFENDAGYISETQAGMLLSKYAKTDEVEEIVRVIVAQMGINAGQSCAFEVREDGHLWLISDKEEDGRFYLNESGHLIISSGTGMDASRYRIDSNGHLFYKIT